MNSSALMTNPDLNESYFELQKEIYNLPTPQNFNCIYDFAKRFANQFGICPRFIEKIYLLGYIDGGKEASKTLKQNFESCEK